jgi:hypothetical protein
MTDPSNSPCPKDSFGDFFLLLFFHQGKKSKEDRTKPIRNPFKKDFNKKSGGNKPPLHFKQSSSKHSGEKYKNG